ncbi:MAG: DUF3800 domain-containing protein [Alphaproteobacteria bacterium]|nr:DUF3800 domain-containing protein [Alphaproteobacteria bacterium]
MYFAYVDETGDVGFDNSPSPIFGLATILVPPEHWLSVLDDAVNLRRLIRQQFGIGPRIELKGSSLLHGRGPFSGMPIKSRLNLYRMVLRRQASWGDRFGVRVFGVVIDKPSLRHAREEDLREKAWVFTLQRLATEGRKNGHLTLLFPDEGYGDFIRRLVRRARRHERVPSAFNPGERLVRDATTILEDPNARQSQDSLFIQLADLDAYAMFRLGYPHPRMGPEMWALLGPALHPDVNKINRGPTGLVVWPRPA